MISVSFAHALFSIGLISLSTRWVLPSGSLEGPSSYLMKSPPRQIQDDDAAELVEEFIERNRREVSAPAPAQV